MPGVDLDNNAALLDLMDEQDAFHSSGESKSAS